LHGFLLSFVTLCDQRHKKPHHWFAAVGLSQICSLIVYDGLTARGRLHWQSTMAQCHTASGIADLIVVAMAAWPIERKNTSTEGKCNHFIKFEGILILKTFSKCTV
jgi:hypothetical protein